LNGIRSRGETDINGHDISQLLLSYSTSVFALFRGKLDKCKFICLGNRSSQYFLIYQYPLSALPAKILQLFTIILLLQGIERLPAILNHITCFYSTAACLSNRIICGQGLVCY